MSGGKNPVTFDTVLKRIRTESKNSFEIGDKFENIMVDFFKTDSVFKKRFVKIWKWSDWAKENNIKRDYGTGHDLGIDNSCKRGRRDALCHTVQVL